MITLDALVGKTKLCSNHCHMDRGPPEEISEIEKGEIVHGAEPVLELSTMFSLILISCIGSFLFFSLDVCYKQL